MSDIGEISTPSIYPEALGPETYAQYLFGANLRIIGKHVVRAEVDKLFDTYQPLFDLGTAANKSGLVITMRDGLELLLGHKTETSIRLLNEHGWYWYNDPDAPPPKVDPMRIRLLGACSRNGSEVDPERQIRAGAHIALQRLAVPGVHNVIQPKLVKMALGPVENCLPVSLDELLSRVNGAADS